MWGNAVSRRDVDLVELTRLVEDALGGREAEDRQGCATERGDPAELDRSHDPEALLGPAGHDSDLLPDPKVLLGRGLGVDVDVVRSGWPVPGGPCQRGEVAPG